MVKKSKKTKKAQATINLAFKATFPPDATRCARCETDAVVSDVNSSSCLNCGYSETRRDERANNVRAAEAGKAMLPMPMPIQFTARELIALQTMLAAKNVIEEMRKPRDEKGREIINEMYEKVFAVARAWWDDAEASTRMAETLEKITMAWTQVKDKDGAEKK